MINQYEWWICDGRESLIQGPGFEFTTLLEIDNNNLLVRSAPDPDDPIEIPIDKLVEFLEKYSLPKEFIGPKNDAELEITHVDVPRSHPSWPAPSPAVQAPID